MNAALLVRHIYGRNFESSDFPQLAEAWTLKPVVLCWASLCLISSAWKLEVTAICAYVKKAQGLPLSPLHLLLPPTIVAFNKADWTRIRVPS